MNNSNINTYYINSDDALKNVVGGEKDSVDNLSVKAATPKKKTYSWEIEENKSPR